eukprot:CAMPEP_0202978196 /NCGR_PEP_ID=MMETSP1396-20130829/84705_1 /ASSEMBLY_ACC=CAM_ASM_000872 /TAXON_ID= /ORGANISM="Pseudokeronopsis sp., Strain Brazil" /LENGTH=104 /DNA_ID=CAMNT_0049717093 /DNA_START=1353 /DNA_END=1667 /DNA_ORIENTATION=-
MVPVLIHSLPVFEDKSGGSDFDKEIEMITKGLKMERVTLDTGAEGFFIYRTDLDQNQKRPMLVYMHGGPFTSDNADIYSTERLMFLLQGYSFFSLNYRGSIGYG